MNKKLVCFVTDEHGAQDFVTALDKDRNDSTQFILDDYAVMDITDDDINEVAHDDDADGTADLLCDFVDVVIDAMCYHHNHGHTNCDKSCLEDKEGDE
jgi:hypothetical protein